MSINMRDRAIEILQSAAPYSDAELDDLRQAVSEAEELSEPAESETVEPVGVRACIERRYLGGCELLGYSEWVDDVIVDREVAARVARDMLASSKPYAWNEGEGAGVEQQFIITDREILAAALAEEDES